MYQILINIDENKPISEINSTHAYLYLSERIGMPKNYLNHIRKSLSRNKINPKLIDLLCFQDFVEHAKGRKWSEVKDKIPEYVSMKFKK